MQRDTDDGSATGCSESLDGAEGVSNFQAVKLSQKRSGSSMYDRYKITLKWHKSYKKWNAVNIIGTHPSKQVGKTIEKPLSYREVKRWSNSFDALLKHRTGRSLFREFLKNEHSEENLLFWESVEVFRTIPPPDLKEFGKDIYDEFVSKEASAEVNLAGRTRTSIESELKRGTVPRSLYDQAQQEVYKGMERDSFERFCRSESYKDFLESQIDTTTIKSWGTDFKALMSHDRGLHLFREFLTAEKSDENLKFWEAVQQYKQLQPGTATMKKRARDIFGQFLSTQAGTEVCIDAMTRRNVEKGLDNPTVTTFKPAENQAYKALGEDCYERFARSDIYMDYLRKAQTRDEAVEQKNS